MLLDEIEKAKPDIFNILLQVMDRGTLTDTNGREANFRNVVLVMTTNIGATQASRRSIGFTKQDHSVDAMEAIRRGFTPEFRNRLDAVVQFQALGFEHILRVVDKFLIELELQLHEKHVALSATPAAREWLGQQGFDPLMGARPMARLIQQTIKTPLADEVLFARLKNGGAVKVVVVQSETGIKVLGLEFPDGPAKPKPEKDVAAATAKRVPKPRAKTAAAGKTTKTPPRRGPKGSGTPDGTGGAPKASALSLIHI